MNRFHGALLLGVVVLCIAITTTESQDHGGKYPKDSEVYKRWHDMFQKLSSKCKTVAETLEGDQTGDQGKDCKAISAKVVKTRAVAGGCTEKEYDMMKDAICSGVTVWISWSLILVCLLIQAVQH